MIEGPLAHISEHVIQTPKVWKLLSRRMKFVLTVLAEPSAFVELGGIISKKISRRRSRTTSVFPFCFGWQSIKNSGLRVQPATVHERGILRQTVDRVASLLSHTKTEVNVLWAWPRHR